ncbi:MAG TPA: Asp-tRNA(Asn)/Glu-tRNA(Gln) amidotransferase subunit GatC [Gemmatimonadaceae bacterium]|nr:Asp-tRNA(Asn)/Glu-tRNA(Gln) amidotransferase subunit GatC [Gemmatimonadaceae bacterium]
MAVSREDVLHIAGLARLGVPEDRVEALVRELNGILGHMEVLQQVESAGAVRSAQDAREAMPLRADAPPGVALERAREDFAPKMRAGFFLVPRLATHDDPAEES